MKKIKLLAALVAVTAFSAPAFSIAQIGVQGNYVSDTFSPGSSEASGVGVGGFARFTVGLPLLVTFGFGPYVDYADLTGPNSSKAKQLRAGGELVVYADVIGNVIGLTPYARFGWGYVGNTNPITIGNASGDVLYYGTGGHTQIGLTYKVLPMIYVFAEGGPQWASLKAVVPDALKSIGTFGDQTSAGWRASVGVMIWL